MKIENSDLSLLAYILCDYTEIEGTGITPPELELIARIATEANFPQSTIEALWRKHAEAEATLAA